MLQEFIPYQPVMYLHSSSEKQFLLVGNGVHLDTEVTDRVESEETRTIKGRGICRILHKYHFLGQIPSGCRGIDLVEVHFLPKLANGKAAYSPQQVPEKDRAQIRVDCIAGFLSLAYYLAQNAPIICGHCPNEDFLLHAETNPSFAFFLRQNCGFRGSSLGNKAWIEQNAFSSQQNQEHMLQRYYALLAARNEFLGYF